MVEVASKDSGVSENVLVRPVAVGPAAAVLLLTRASCISNMELMRLGAGLFLVDGLGCRWLSIVDEDPATAAAAAAAAAAAGSALLVARQVSEWSDAVQDDSAGSRGEAGAARGGEEISASIGSWVVFILVQASM